MSKLQRINKIYCYTSKRLIRQKCLFRQDVCLRLNSQARRKREYYKAKLHYPKTVTISPKRAKQPVTLHRARLLDSLSPTSTSTWRNSSWKRGISDTRVRTTGMVRTRWNCLVFPQAVSPFIPREIFARPHFDCTPSESSFLILEIRHLNFSGNPPSLLPLPFGASVAAFLLRGEPSLTRYITEPQNIDPGNCWFVAEVPCSYAVWPLDRGNRVTLAFKRVSQREVVIGDRTWEIRRSMCFAGRSNETDSIEQLGQPG